MPRKTALKRTVVIFVIFGWSPKPKHMFDYFDAMDALLRTFWYVALPTSVIFVIQTILSFIGADAADGLEADFDGDFAGGDAPFQLFSLRNLINFLLGFSWTGISFYELISNQWALLSLSLAVGGLFVYLFFIVIKQVQKLAEDNSFRYEKTIGKTGEVYLTIPAAFAGKGKISLSIKGSVHELEAITAGESLPSGALARVVKIESDNLLVVEKLS